MQNVHENQCILALFDSKNFYLFCDKKRNCFYVIALKFIIWHNKLICLHFAFMLNETGNTQAFKPAEKGVYI